MTVSRVFGLISVLLFARITADCKSGLGSSQTLDFDVDSASDNETECDLISASSPAPSYTINTGVSISDTTYASYPLVTSIHFHGSFNTITSKTTIITINTIIDLKITKLVFKISFTNPSQNSLLSVTNGNLELNQVQVGDSTSVNVDFAVIYLLNFATLKIVQSSFNNIHNVKPLETIGGVKQETYGGVIHGETGVKEAKIEIISSNFTGDSIDAERGYGGAFVITTYGRKAKYSITSCKFTNCESGYYAGAFDLYSYYFYPTVEIDQCEFTGCTSGRDAGAIYVVGNPATVSNSKFVDCTALNDGGGIYFYDEGAANSYNLLHSTFKNCRSLGETARSANGGGLFVEVSGRILVDDCSFTDCIANAFHGHGGAIANVMDGIDFISFTVKNSKFVDCSVDEVTVAGVTPLLTDDGDGGAISIKVALFNTIVLENCEFKQCRASKNGGSVDIEHGSLIVKGCDFENSRADSGNGGSIHTTGVIISIEATTFFNSTLGNSSGKGVEVYSTREIIHYGVGNIFTCDSDNDVVYNDVSLKLVVCDHKTIKDLDCQGPAVNCPVDCPALPCVPASAATHSTAPSSSLFRYLLTALAGVVLTSGVLLL